MFRIIKNPNFDFMGRSKLALGCSLVLVVISIGLITVKGLNKGIEFTGGNELRVIYADTPDVGAIRAALTSSGFSGQSVTTIGDLAENEVVIRLPIQVEEGDSLDHSADVLAALRSQMGVTAEIGNDLNAIGAQPLAEILSASTTSEAEAQALAHAILGKRKEDALFKSYAALDSVPGMTAEARSLLEGASTLGPLALRERSYIGPAVGAELIKKTIAAIIGSLVGMLLYIWVRFQLQWGFAAVVALTHDTLITLGLFALFGQELSLPVVAAFLTLVGYSVNDTVVVFDRIRENLRNRGPETIEATINRSLNQTLSRTIITSGLTWVVVLALLFFGSAALQPFAFVLAVGVIVGTYSSIYIASPFLVLWTEFMAKRRQATATKVPAGGGAR